MSSQLQRAAWPQERLNTKISNTVATRQAKTGLEKVKAASESKQKPARTAGQSRECGGGKTELTKLAVNSSVARRALARAPVDSGDDVLSMTQLTRVSSVVDEYVSVAMRRWDHREAAG